MGKGHMDKRTWAKANLQGCIDKGIWARANVGGREKDKEQEKGEPWRGMAGE